MHSELARAEAVAGGRYSANTFKDSMEQDMRNGLLVAGAVIGALAAAPYARADVIPFAFNGGGISGSGVLTYAPDTVAGDPAGAFTITDISGTFSDANLSIAGATITGIVAANPVNPPVGSPAPVSLGYFAVTNPPAGSNAISYDDLFYPGGSPVTCAGYPLSGGFLDVYGALFTLDNGDTVDLWSDGEGPSSLLAYGAAVIDPNDAVVDYQFSSLAAAVPEPASLAIFAAALFAFGVVRRRPRKTV